ncbi:MAG: redoxin domain-containing protein [Bacteroidetes bacterium]|nr:redoxin domain-containing protein [Bacteroidota bacterium]
MTLQVNQNSIDFTLFDGSKQPFNLNSHKGKKVVLLFLPGAFTGVCTKEVCSFQNSLKSFENLNAVVAAITPDSPFANKGFAEANKINFPILSDYTRTVSTMHGGIHENFAGMQQYSAPKRSVYVIDENGKVIYVWISENPGNEPPYAEVEKALS